MAENQGAGEAKLRGDSVVVVANAIIKGWQDEKNDWHGEHITDWDAFARRLPVQSAADDLGAVVRACLSRSRLMNGDWATARRSAADYVARLTGLFGLSSAKSLYPGMKDVSIVWSAGAVTFRPSRNKRAGVFEGFEFGDRQHADVVLPFTASDAELGDALLEAFRRSL